MFTMKTFKIVDLQLMKENEKIYIPLHDGLIINTENDKGEWVIEAYISNEMASLFKTKKENNTLFQVEAVITRSGNKPALFSVSVQKVREIGENSSILLQGTLINTKQTYAEVILQELIDHGLSGEQLMTEFKQKISNKKQS